MWKLSKRKKVTHTVRIGDPEAWEAVERSYEKLNQAKSSGPSIRTIVNALNTYREENGFADMILASIIKPRGGN